MDAVEFLKEAKRYCKWCENTTQDGKKRLCDACYFEKLNDIFNLHPMAYGKFVETVEQWVKEHPVKTRQSEFLKMFPNAQKSLNGVLDICPRKFEPEKYKSATPDKVCVNGNADDEYHCDECCRDFWLKEIG